MTNIAKFLGEKQNVAVTPDNSLADTRQGWTRGRDAGKCNARACIYAKFCDVTEPCVLDAFGPEILERTTLIKLGVFL